MKKYVNGEYIEVTESEIDEIKRQNQIELLAEKSAELSVEDKLIILANSIPVQTPADIEGTTLPHKLGYKWEAVYDGNAFVWQSVPDADAIGTSATNYIVYGDDVPLINNAFYKVDGVIKVYMDGQWIEW